jgi:hypothetical protein
LAHDFGIRADGPVAMVLYALAGAATLLAGILLALIQPA